MEALIDVKASDLMQTDVFALSPDDRIERAVASFEEYHISGAPVVDGSGRLQGFLSASDIARSDHVQEGRIATEGRNYDMPEAFDDEEESFDKEDYSPEALETGLVKDWMNADVISVAPDASLKDICVLMRTESIHRVLVVKKEKLIGIVSTTDVVRHLADQL